MITCILWDLENLKNGNPLTQLDIPLQKQLLETGLGTDVSHVCFLANHGKGRHNFAETLNSIGIETISKAPKEVTNKDGSKFKECDMDANIVFYLLTQTNSYDNIILLSGDGDMFETLSYLKKKGKNISVKAIRGRISRKLRDNFPTEHLTGFKTGDRFEK